DYIHARDLERPIGLGRIWRIVHDTTKLERKPAMSKAPPAELVQALSHPNGWWRDTAQQLLVQRHEMAVAPQLKQLAGKGTDWKVRLHALWTLDGLDAIGAEDVQQALADKSPYVRAAGIRLAERWFGEPGSPLPATVLKLVDDPNWVVRRQFGATVGELP